MCARAFDSLILFDCHDSWCVWHTLGGSHEAESVLAFLCEWRVMKPSLVVFDGFVFDHPQLNSLRSEADAMISEGKKLCYAKLIWRYADFLWFIHRSWWKHPKDHHWRWDSASPWSIFLHFEGQNQSQIPLALPWLWFSDSFNASDISQFTIISQVFTSDIYVFGFLNSAESITEAPTNHAFFSHICGWCHLAFSWSPEAFDNCACADTDWLIVAEYYLVLLIFQNMSCMSCMSRNDTECPRLLTFEWGQRLGHVDKLELQSAWEDCCVEISNRRITDI